MAAATLARSGIYCIRNIVSGRRYVGSSVDIAKRFRAHRSLLQRGEHHASTLQRSWLKHGAEAFTFTVLEFVDAPEMLVEREQFWIDRLAAFGRRGFNSSPTAGNCLGVRHTKETKAKLSAQRKGVAKSSDHRAAIGAAHRGRALPEEQRQRTSEGVRRHFAEHPEARERMREVGRRNGLLTKGRKMSAEVRAAMSAARKSSATLQGVARQNLAKATPEQLARGQKMAAIGRKGRPRPDRRALTFGQAEQIRAEKAAGATYRALSDEWGLTAPTLFQIVKGRTYQRP